jgi:TonB-dependent receptor
MINKVSKVSSAVLMGIFYSSVVVAQEGPTEESSQNIEKISVVGVRSSLEAALYNKRYADSIQDGLSADDVGKFPDLNLAESLQRVTGIQMDYAGDEGERREGRIAIRGLPVDYAITTYNGQILAAPRPDLGFSFGNIESSVISAVNVIKTPTAKMDEGGLSGIIDIRSKRALDVSNDYFSVGVKGTYETLTEETSPGYSFAFGKKMLDDKFGIVGSLAIAEQKFRSDVIRVNKYKSEDLDGDGSADVYTPSEIRVLSRKTEGDRTSATLGLEYELNENLKFGLNALYVDDPYTHDWVMGQIDKAKVTQVLDSVTNDTFGTTVTRLNMVNPRVRNQQRLIEVDNKTQAITADFEWASESWIITGAIHRTEASQLATGAIARRQLKDGIDNGINLLVDTGAGNVDNFILRDTTGGLSNSDAYAVSGCSPAEISSGDSESRCVTSSSGVGDWFLTYDSGHEYDATDEERAYQLDIEHMFDDSFIESIETGLKIRQSEQSFVRPEWALPNDEFDYSGIPDSGSLISFNDFTSSTGFFDGRLGNQIDNFYFQDGVAMRQALVGDRTFSDRTFGGLPYPADGGDIASTFSLTKRDILSAYAMANFNFEKGSIDLPIRGNIGLRYVDTSRETDAFRDNNGNLEPLTAKTDFSHLLPSLNVTWEIQDDLLLRGAFSETIVRPHARNFGVGQNVDINSTGDVTDSINIELGNPELKPFESTSFDLSLEWYVENGPTITMAYFQKEVSNGFDDRVLCPTNIADIQALENAGLDSLLSGPLSFNSSGICADPSGAEVLITDQVNNADSFDISGFEIALLQSFDFIDIPIIRNMGIQANYTYVDTSEGPDKDASGNSLPLAGVSDDTINLIVFYEAEQFAVRLAYTARSDYFDETTSTVSGDNRFIDTQDRLDMQVSYSPKQIEDLFLTLEMFNLTNEQFYAYQGTENRFREAREIGRTISFQAQYRF